VHRLTSRVGDNGGWCRPEAPTFAEREITREAFTMAPSHHQSPASANSHVRIGVAASLTVLAFAVGSMTLTSTPAGAVGPTVPPNGPVTQRKQGPPAPVVTQPAAAPAKAAKRKSPSRKPAKAKAASTKASGFGQGAKGDQVVAVQTRLQELKYDITDTSGKFGDQTYHAVMAFQKLNGLSRTGRVGSQTLAALESADPSPTPMLPDGGPDRIEVDIKRQILMVWNGGEIAHILSISTGSGKDFCVLDPETNKTECDKAITPGGSFRVTRRWIGWRESKLGEMYNPLYFNGGIAIHGSPSVPAYPASHGCVRIPMVSAEWFPEAVPDGTPVYVFSADKTPTPLRSKGPSSTKPTVPGGSTPGSTTPGATVPPTAPTTPTTVPPSTIVRLLPLGSTTTTIAPSIPPATVPLTASTVPTTPAPTTLAATTTTTVAPTVPASSNPSRQ
jgi:peptidoglycan hydrolase-like protein with peptidoglycan-binding domain